MIPEVQEAQARWHDDRARQWKRWTDWKPLHEVAASIDKGKGPPGKPGVYALRAQGVPLQRMLGTDQHGVLDIGESRVLARRLWELFACASGRRKSGHMAGWRYAFLRLPERLGVHSLDVAWRAGDDCYRLEAEAMKAYLDAFGELPPLNYKANWALLSG